MDIYLFMSCLLCNIVKTNAFFTVGFPDTRDLTWHLICYLCTNDSSAWCCCIWRMSRRWVLVYFLPFWRCVLVIVVTVCSQVTLNGLVTCVFVQSGLGINTTNRWVFYHWKDWDCSRYTIHSHTCVCNVLIGFSCSIIGHEIPKKCARVCRNRSNSFGKWTFVWHAWRRLSRIK